MVVEFCAALLSLPTTVIVFAPVLSVTDRLQFAVAAPVAVPPLAATPLTVTEDMPLFPNPESLAVPATVIGLARHRLVVRVAGDRYRGTRGI